MPDDPDTRAGKEATGPDGDGPQGPLTQTADVAPVATGEDVAEPRPSEKAFKRTFSSLSLVSFRHFWIGMLLQQGAMQMQMLARGYFVFELTGSPAILGVVSLAGAGPSLVLGLFGGVMADRLDKKRVIQWGQRASMLLALVIAVSITTGTVTWQHLVGASVVQGALMPVLMPARQAVIPQLVPRERLMNAVALNSMAMSVTTLLGPAVAGGIIVFLGIDGVYYAVAAMFAASLLFTGLLPSFPPRARDPGEKRPLVIEDLKEGLRYVRGKKVILQLLLMAFATMMLAMPIRMALPIFAKETFSVGAAGLGIMLSFIGVGGLVGALFIASSGNVARRGHLLAVSGIASGAAVLGFAVMAQFAPMYWSALLFMMVIGVIQAGRMALNNTLMMEHTDDEYRGRVMSIFTLNFALMPLGVALVTIAAEFIDPPVALGIMAVTLIAVSGTLLAVSRELRQAA